jgi:hypothetical protein
MTDFLMSKYLCICGVGFRKKKQADDHVKVFSDAESAWPHQVVKKNWKGRWIDFLIASRRYWKFTGILIIYFTITIHFGIKPNLWEGLAMGIGMGLAID